MAEENCQAKDTSLSFLAFFTLTTTLYYTVKECKRRWRTLRERFVREMKTLKADGSGRNGVEFIPWKLACNMDFLQEFVSHRRYGDNIHSHYGTSCCIYQMFNEWCSLPLWDVQFYSSNNNATHT